MSTDTDRLEREAEEHRSQVDDTIERLKSRFSVGQIVDELSGYVREGQGADMVKNLNRQVRDNPLALGLVGAGIAWLLMGDGVRDRGNRLRDRYDDWRGDDEDDDDRFERAFPPSGSPARRSAYSGYPADGGRGYGTASGGGSAYTDVSYAEDDLGSGGPGLADRARGAASSVGSAASGAASSVGGAASSVGSAASQAASSVGSAASQAAGTVGGAFSSAGERLNRTSHDVRDAAYRYGETGYRGAAYAGRRASSLGRRAGRTFLDTLQEEPLIVGAVAVAIGAAIGASLPSTRQEDEWLGETRDRLRDNAAEYGRDALHRAEHVAAEAYKAGSEEAERKGLKPTGDGETLAEKVSSVVGAAVDTAKTEAKKEGLS